MYNHRQIYAVKHQNSIIAFEYPEQADDYAQAMGAHWEPARLYLSGHKPDTWTVYTAEAAIWTDGEGSIEPEGPDFGSYTTSEVEGTPHESEPCVMVVEEYDNRRWARCIGTDQDKVEQRIKDWHIAERAVRT